MASKYTLGNSAVLSASTTVGGTLVPVKQIKSISFSGSSVNFDDITNLDSTGSYQEFVPTTINPGNAQFEGVFVGSDPGQQMLSAAFETKSVLHFTLQFAAGVGESTGLKRVWDAYMAEKPNIAASTQKSVSYSGSLRITGPIVDTPAVLATP